MAEIRLGKNESLDTALKRFKRSCARDGVLAEVRKREHYEGRRTKRKESVRKIGRSPGECDDSVWVDFGRTGCVRPFYFPERSFLGKTAD